MGDLWQGRWYCSDECKHAAEVAAVMVQLEDARTQLMDTRMQLLDTRMQLENARRQLRRTLQLLAEQALLVDRRVREEAEEA